MTYWLRLDGTITEIPADRIQVELTDDGPVYIILDAPIDPPPSSQKVGERTVEDVA